MAGFPTLIRASSRRGGITPISDIRGSKTALLLIMTGKVLDECSSFVLIVGNAIAPVPPHIPVARDTGRDSR